MILAILKTFVLSPKVAALMASLQIGRPYLADDLIDICMRESRCNAIGTHKIDEHISNNEWWGQTKLGTRYRKRGIENKHLDKRCQKRKLNHGMLRCRKQSFGLLALLSFFGHFYLNLSASLQDQ